MGSITRRAILIAGLVLAFASVLAPTGAFAKKHATPVRGCVSGGRAPDSATAVAVSRC